MFPKNESEGKTFHGDLNILFEKLKSKKPFVFSKYADGEFWILKGQKVGNNEFQYNPNNKEFHEMIMNSFTYNHPDYYIGIGCPCCMGEEDWKWMKETSGRSEDHITWANLFVNSNYEFYKDYMISEYNNHKVILVCNEKADLSNMPFHVKKDFRCKDTAWENGGFELIEEITEYISFSGISNYLFLFCAGPFGNILSHQLHDFCNENIYLDIGSTLDPYLFGKNGFTRNYLRGSGTLEKVCIWR